MNFRLRSYKGTVSRFFSLFPNFWGKFESANFADVTERSQDLRVHNSFFVRREPHLRRPGQKLLSFGCGWWYDREIVLLPPLGEVRERLPDNEHEHRIQVHPGQEGIAIHSHRALLGRLAADGCKPRHGRYDLGSGSAAIARAKGNGRLGSH